MSYTIPSDSNAVGNSGHVGDHNNIVDVLTGMDAVFNILNTAYAGGADPTGTNDSAAAINAALTAASSGGTVYFPAGTYKTTASIVIPNDSTILAGAGMYATIIKPTSGAQFDAISTAIPGSAGTSGFIRNYLGIRDMTLDCSQMTGTTAGKGNGIHFYGVRYSEIKNVFISSCPNWAILLYGDNTGPGNNFGYNNRVERCIIDLGAAGYMANACEANEIVECIFKFAKTATAANQPVFASPSTYAGHMLLTSGYHYVAGCVFGNGGTYTTEAIKCTNSGPARIVGNRFDQVRYQAFHPVSGPQIFTSNQLGNPSSIGTVPAIDIGAGGMVVTGNNFDVTNGATHWTYCIFEEGAYVGNCYIGNHFIAGTSGTVSTNGGSTGGVNTNNSIG